MDDKKIKDLEQQIDILNKKLAFYKAAIRALPNPVFIKNDDLHFCFFSDSYKEFFDLSDGQYIGMGVKDLPYLSEDDRKRYHNEDRQALKEGSVVHYEAVYPKGEDMRESFYWSTGFESEEGEKGIVGEIVDISNEKHLERELEKYVQELEIYGLKVEAASRLDPLTGLFNRRIFDEMIPAVINKCNNEDTEVYVFVMDIDYFKTVNDTYGHAKGDEVLKEFSNLIMDNIRRDDIAVRYGGDEFMIILPGITKSAAVLKADHICHSTRELIRLPDGTPVTCSIGIARHFKDPDFRHCIHKADDALYQAKEAGRNCIKYCEEQ